ncbi:MAG: CHC2 zinc finger domain-containing protein, partial [Kiritimatiellia bacterium]
MDLETLKEEVRARADIVDIIGRQVQLKKASGNWVGLCPFHNEKSPSFNVNPQRQTYHCFGCGVGGDVFKFVMEMEHLDFMGALEKLAHQTGVEFELDGSRGKSGLKRRLLEL